MSLALAAVLIQAALPAPPQEQPAEFDIRAETIKLAFDPSNLFNDVRHANDLVRITYLGDDWGWPVYAIAIRNGCGGDVRVARCGEQRRARMVRATVPVEGTARPRWRGSALVGRLRNAKVADRAALADALDAEKLDWLEADLGSCPGALAALGRAADVKWVLPHLIDPAVPNNTEIVLHADTIKVEFPDYLRVATYNGYIAPGSPAAWADELAKTLEPCWKPAIAPPPWRSPKN